MIEFMVCKKGGTNKYINEWIHETMKIFKDYGFDNLKILHRSNELDVTAIYVKCFDKQFNELMANSNLVIDQTVRGIHFMKSV